MSRTFETLGNATVLVCENLHPILATDPWLIGTCYFGSWALDHPLTSEQIAKVIGADYIWISHGHPDHLHDESLALFPRGKKVLLPDHYCSEIADHLRQSGFEVTILPYRKWFPISPTMRVMCVANVNQDAILFIEVGDALIVNLNDSPLCGEFYFIRSLVRQYDQNKTYLLALCSVDADMFNFVDESGRSLVGPAEERKPGAIWRVARLAKRIGVGTFCCSSSQHLYVRADSKWANPYRIGWADMKRYWSRPQVRLIEPFVTVNVATGEFTQNHSSQQPDVSQISEHTADDDWGETLNSVEWSRVEAFVYKFELIRRYIDFIEFVVGGERKRYNLGSGSAGSMERQRGVIFFVPRHSLLKVVEYGYLDDLLIGNFAKVRLVNCTLYPRFTPLVAKLGGNAKVYTQRQYRQFTFHYLVRNPFATVAYLLEVEVNYRLIPWLREASESTGLKRPLRYIYRSLLGDPVRY